MAWVSSTVACSLPPSLSSLSGRLEHLNSIAQNNNNTTTIIIFINTLFYPQHFGQESGSQLTTKTTIALYLFHTRSHSMRSSLLHGNKHDWSFFISISIFVGLGIPLSHYIWFRIKYIKNPPLAKSYLSEEAHSFVGAVGFGVDQHLRNIRGLIQRRCVDTARHFVERSWCLEGAGVLGRFRTEGDRTMQ